MLDMESVLTAVDITWTNEIGHRCQIQETEIQKQVAGAFTTRQASSAQSRWDCHTPAWTERKYDV